MKEKDTQAQADKVIYEAQMAIVNRAKNTIKGFMAFFVVACIAYFAYKVFSPAPPVPKTDSIAEQAPEEQLAQSDEELQAARTEFKTALSEFESTVQPQLENPELIAWNKNSIERILKSKQLAITSFSQGAYSSALNQLQAASDNTVSLVEKWNESFETKYTEALNSFNEKDINRTRLAIAQALQIKSAEPRLSNLQAQLEVYPQVATLYKKLKVARTENNLDKQIDILTQIFAIDPQQQGVAKALKKAQRQRNDNVFQQHINNGLNQLAQGNSIAASRSLKKAAQLYPNSQEVKLLARKLGKVEFNNTLDATHTQLKSLEENDDWKAIDKMINRVITRFPGDQLISEYSRLSKTVLKLKAQASDFVNRPKRLADDNIQNLAKQLIREAVPYLPKSPSLAQDVKIIGSYIDQFSQRFPVTINSDGKTNIIVKGVGTVGKLTEKVIQLVAGDYTLEGSRKGYRTKQVNFNVTDNQPNQISLVCDERI